MSETKHSDTPWTFDEVMEGEKFSEADVRHIVRCVNCHDDLLAACKAVLDLNVTLDSSHLMALRAVALATRP